MSVCILVGFIGSARRDEMRLRLSPIILSSRGSAWEVGRIVVSRNSVYRFIRATVVEKTYISSRERFIMVG